MHKLAKVIVNAKELDAYAADMKVRLETFREKESSIII